MYNEIYIKIKDKQLGYGYEVGKAGSGVGKVKYIRLYQDEIVIVGEQKCRVFPKANIEFFDYKEVKK